MVAKGTGEAIKLGEQRRCRCRCSCTTRSREEAFVADGYGVKRYPVMYNDFIIVGPEVRSRRPQAACTMPSRRSRKIVAGQGVFASRGDDSGTNQAELRLWKQAGIDVKPLSGVWYYETGSGMGPTLNTAADMGAYTLTDRATWTDFKNKRQPACRWSRATSGSSTSTASCW